MNSAEVLIKFKGETDSVDEAQKKVEDNFSSLQKKGEIAFAGLTAAADAFAGSILKSGINYNAQIETYLTRLTTLTGSTEKANDILNQIKKDALATPFEVSSLTQAESLLLSTGLSAEQSRKDILALGDAVAASGGGNEELQRMAVNLQQIKNVGKASALDIKQFAYAGIDIYGLLADSLGVTREKASKMTITYDMLSNALQNASQKGGKYYGAMDKQSKTYAGSMSNLKEAVDVFKGELSKGLFNALKKIIPQLSKFFNWLTKNKNVILAITVPLLTFVNIMAGFLIIKKIVGLFQALWAVMAANPIVAIIAVIGALVAGFIYLWDNCEAFRNFWINLWKNIKIVINGAINGIKGIINGLINVFKTIWQTIETIIMKPFEIAFTFIGSSLNNFINVVGSVIGTVAGLFSGFWNGLRSGFQAVWNGIKSVFSGVGTFFKNVFQNAWNVIKGIFSVGGQLFEGIKNGVAQVFKTMVNLLIKGINNVISIPFKTINGLLNTIRNVKIPVINKKPFKGLWKQDPLPVPKIPKLATGTNEVPDDMLAMIHKGEAVVPKKFNPYVNGMNSSMLGIMNNNKGNQVINVYASFKQDNLGQMVRDIKTFSGGARNDFNYGSGV